MRTQKKGEKKNRGVVGKGVKVTFQETLEDVIRRDRNDMTRAISPLRKAKDAVVIVDPPLRGRSGGEDDSVHSTKG
jgi:cytidylate kinase